MAENRGGSIGRSWGERGWGKPMRSAESGVAAKGCQRGSIGRLSHFMRR